MRSSAFALLALLAAACRGDSECCAFPNDIMAEVVDEAGRPVSDALVEFARPDGQPTATPDSTGEGPSMAQLRTDSAGMAIHYSSSDSVYFRLTVTPPAGYALADSARASETLLHYRGGSLVRFVLKRAREPARGGIGRGGFAPSRRGLVF